eukprot:scaffold3513_cov102-Cylindrotheca_fusiformis.AAC.8
MSSLFTEFSTAGLVTCSIVTVGLGYIISSMVFSSSSSPTSMLPRKLFGSSEEVTVELEKFPTEMQIEELEKAMPGCQHGYFKSTAHGGAKLHYRYWLPKEDGPELKGVVVFFHGISAHGGRGLIMDGRKLSSTLLAEMFLEQGIAIYSLDFYGHGYSEGTRFLVKNWKFNLQDCIEFALFASKRHPKSLPLFLAGESYGGCLAIHTAKYFQDNPGTSNFDSVLLAAPAIHGDLPSFPVYHILRYVFAPLMPKAKPFFMPHPLSANRIWRDEKVAKHFTESEYASFHLDDGASKLRLGTALGCVLAMEEVCNNTIPDFKVPFCIIHGTKDEGVPIGGSQFMIQNAQTPKEDKQLHAMDGATHDLLCDPSAEVALGHWMKFVRERIEKRNS